MPTKKIDLRGDGIPTLVLVAELVRIVRDIGVIGLGQPGLRRGLRILGASSHEADQTGTENEKQPWGHGA